MDPSPRRRKTPRARARGFTLVELLVTILLIAVLAGTLIAGSGMMSSGRLRSAAGLVVTGVRLAVTRANVSGHAVRLVFDLDEGSLLMEETTDRMLRVKETTDTKKSEGVAAGADPASQAEKEATQYADGIIKGPKAARAHFKGIPFGSTDPDPAHGRKFGRGVHYRLVQTEHDGKPREKGRSYLYVWPGGTTERAVVQIERDGSEDVLSVLVSPLTGRAKIQHGKVELTSRRSEEEFGQREGLQ